MSSLVVYSRAGKPTRLALVILLAACGGDAAETPIAPETPVVVPPAFEGIGDVGPDVLMPTDPTTLTDFVSMGRDMRLMHDDRLQDTATVDAHLFQARFADGATTEFEVNPEFDSTSAHGQAEQLAHMLGQMPSALRSSIDTVWVQGGDGSYWAIWWAGTLLLHKGLTDELLEVGLVEEILLHEVSHMGLEAAHDTTEVWRAAQVADARFISDYARDFPTSEDMAESFVAWVAVRYRSDRITSSVLTTIQERIPNRLAFFDGLGLDLDPIR